MANQKIIQTHFDGGISSNSKSGLPNSALFHRFLNIFDDSDSVTPMPAPSKVSGTTVTDFIKWGDIASPFDTNIYFLGDTGIIYKVTSNGVWSVDHTDSITNTGQGMLVFNDFLYYAGQQGIGRKGPLSQTPSYSDDFLNTTTTSLDRNNTANGSTYTTPVAISELAADTFSWTPQFDPLSRIDLYVVTKGTGSITITVHDSYNNVLGTVTKANGAITAGSLQGYIFTTPVRVTIGQTYHFHVTSSASDSTLNTGTGSSLANATVKTYFGVLVMDSDFHPMIQATNGVSGTLIIGNERYLAQWDGLSYNPNKITFEPGWKVRGLFKQNEYIVAYCWKGTSIDSTEHGRLYFWDGISPYFNFYKPIQEGLPNAMISTKLRMFGVFGSIGNIALALDESSPIRLIQPAPQLARGKTVEVLPGAIAVWNRRVLFGMWSSDDGGSFQQGVYEFGNQSDRAITYTSVSTEVLSLSYAVTTIGSTQSKIGCLLPAGRDLYVTWKDGTSYGVSKVSKTSSAATNCEYESLIIDQGFLNGQVQSMPEKTKAAVKLVITFAPLPANCQVTPKYKLDRMANPDTISGWWFGPNVVTVGSQRAELLFTPGGNRYREIQIGFDLFSSGEFPVITGIYFEYDPLVQEVSES